MNRSFVAILGIVWAAACGQSAFACEGDGRTGFPAEWFAAVPRDGAPDWEILPQEAGPCEVILSKRNELGILSNFAATPVEVDGVRYASVEGFWQMMKYPEGPNDPRATAPGVTWTLTRAEVGQLTAFEAKRAGDVGSKAMKALGINYVTYAGKQLPYRVEEKGEHYHLIRRAMWAKVMQNDEVRRILMRTGDLTLKADHKPEANQPPAWNYFDIWMDVRAQIQRETEASTGH